MSITVDSRDEASQPALPLSWQAPVVPAAVSLLAEAKRCLAEAESATEPAARFTAAYLSGLRAAAGVLAARGRPHRGRARPASVWVLLRSVAPEFAEWADFFAEHSAVHAAAQAGITRRVRAEAADELAHRAAQFLRLAHLAVHGTSREEPRQTGRAAPCVKPSLRRTRG